MFNDDAECDINLFGFKKGHSTGTVNRTIDYYLKRGSHASLISVKLSTGSTREFRNPWGQLLETVSTNVRGG